MQGHQLVGGVVPQGEVGGVFDLRHHLPGDRAREPLRAGPGIVLRVVTAVAGRASSQPSRRIASRNAFSDPMYLG